jgi:hypothetical protein
MKIRRIAIPVIVAAAAALGSAGAATSVAPAGRSLTSNHVKSFAGLFSDNVFLGGQVAPRLYKWVNPNTSIFVQLDSSDPARATSVRYVGIGVKGTFCAETQPGGPKGGFTHFHRISAPQYSQGHGGPPGAQGYWLMWVAVDEFTAGDGRKIGPGVDYAFSPTPPPTCGGAPKPDFEAPGARNLAQADIRRFANFFHDNPFLGGQKAPRLYRWVNGDTLIFLQFDNRDVAKAKALRYIGVSRRGAFCRSDQPSSDFTHFDRRTAKEYAKAAGGKPRQGGFWSIAIAVDTFKMPWGQVTPGPDRKFAKTAAPECPKA